MEWTGNARGRSADRPWTRIADDLDDIWVALARCSAILVVAHAFAMAAYRRRIA